MNETDPWNPEDLGLSPREAEEAAGLMAFAAPQRRPPAALKERVLAGLGAENPAAQPLRLDAVPKEPQDAAASAAQPPRPALSRWSAAAAAFACAALILAWGARPWRHGAVVAEAIGPVTVDGRPLRAGTTLKPGQVVAVSGDGEAVVVFASRAAVRLLHGGEISYRQDKELEVSLRAGWMLSAVVSGAAYSVRTNHGRIAALGTDFLAKAREADTYFCICHGRLAITGRFDSAEAASENHEGWVFDTAAPRRPNYGTMEGHSDPEIASLRAFLK